MHAVAGSEDASLSVTAGYDAIAAGYDAQVSGDAWMRRALHAHFAELFLAGQRILDVGCGTGIDAVALARRGVHVVGIDGSSEMIRQCHARVSAAGVASLVDARVLRIESLSELADERFDGLISAFASLSSVADLNGFARAAARLVRPRGRLVLHLLNRFSLWEWLGFVRGRKWTAAAQVGRQRTRPFVIGGESVPHRLYFADEAFARFFRAEFLLRRRYGLGAVRPPHTVRRLPERLAPVLEWLDVHSGGWPLLRDAGRFFVLDLERRAT